MRLALAIVLSMFGCHLGPSNPHYPPDTDDPWSDGARPPQGRRLGAVAVEHPRHCYAVCDHVRELGCSWSARCSDQCQNVMEKPPAVHKWNLSCLLAKKSCDELEACK